LSMYHFAIVIHLSDTGNLVCTADWSH